MADEFGASARPKPTNKKLEAGKVRVHVGWVCGGQNMSVPILVRKQMLLLSPETKKKTDFFKKRYIHMLLPSSNA